MLPIVSYLLKLFKGCWAVPAYRFLLVLGLLIGVVFGSVYILKRQASTIAQLRTTLSQQQQTIVQLEQVNLTAAVAAREYRQQSSSVQTTYWQRLAQIITPGDCYDTSPIANPINPEASTIFTPTATHSSDPAASHRRVDPALFARLRQAVTE